MLNLVAFVDEAKLLILSEVADVVFSEFVFNLL